MKKAVNWLINSAWTLTYEDHGDKTITILAYNRADPWGYTHHNPKCHLREGYKRTVYQAIINGETFNVRNPQYIFDYNQAIPS